MRRSDIRSFRWLAPALLALAFTSAPLAAQEWESLGSREVSFARERDVIAVAAREGRFRAIKIEVDQGAIEMFNLRVTFGDGQRFSPETRLVFGEDSRSRRNNTTTGCEDDPAFYGDDRRQWLQWVSWWGGQVHPRDIT